MGKLNVFVSMFIIGFIAFLTTLLSCTTIQPQEMSGWNRLFVYGTLKRGEPNYKFMEDGEKGKAIFIGTATTVQKWPLVIASRYNIPFLLHKQGTGNNVAGEVYDVDNALLSTLDELEGHPHFYERIKYDVVIDNVAVNGTNATQTVEKCWIYLLQKFKPSLLELPYLTNYSAYGSHGLEYVTSEDLNNPEDI